MVSTFAATWPSWAVMWTLAAAIFVACKVLSLTTVRSADAPLTRRVAYLLLWPGLDARSFLCMRPGTISSPAAFEWFFASAKLLLGATITWWIVPQVPAEYALARGWLGMLGLIFVLHFGAFHLLSCAWRAAGIDAKPLMNAPIRSTSVNEFWGRRWNTAFRDFTHRFIFRPFTKALGPQYAILAGFLFSGLIHDAVISWPAGGGYGLPTFFFVLQGVALLVERSSHGKAVGLGGGWRGWLFTFAVVAGPAYWLFHPAFVLRVIVPFLDVIGSY